MKTLSIILFGLLVSFDLYASQRNVRDTESSTVLTDSMSTLGSVSSMLLTDLDKSLAKQWMLKDSDWIKYKKIMSGPRGIWSPGIDPITALGVSETDPVERKRYAEIWIRMETRRAELEIAFEVERQRAARLIHRDQLAVNNQPWIQEWENKRVEVTKQVSLFIEVDCIDDCQAMFNELRASVGENARLDVFFKQGASSEEIGEWASSMNIPPETVRDRRITLNFDEEKSSSMEVDMSSLPQVRVTDLKTGEVSVTYK